MVSCIRIAAIYLLAFIHEFGHQHLPMTKYILHYYTDIGLVRGTYLKIDKHGMGYLGTVRYATHKRDCHRV